MTDPSTPNPSPGPNEPTSVPRENEPPATETAAPSDDELKEQLQSTLPGSGQVLEDRVNAVLTMYDHLRNNQGDTVQTYQYNPNDHGTDDADPMDNNVYDPTGEF